MATSFLFLWILNILHYPCNYKRILYDEIDIIAKKHKNAAKTTPDKVVAVVASKP